MRMNHHLSEATLLGYVAGRLPEASNVVAASHIAWCGQCRRGLRDAETSAGAALAELSQAALPARSIKRSQMVIQASQKAKPARRVADTEEPDCGLPGPLLRLLGGRDLCDLSWRRVLPGLAFHDLALSSQSPGRLRLVRLAPGKALPEHRHGGAELALVLRGSYSDHLGRFSIGDVADLDGSVVHRPVADGEEACLCLVSAEAPAMLTSLLGRLVQPLIGI